MRIPSLFPSIPVRFLACGATALTVASCGPEIEFPHAPLPPVPPSTAGPPYAAFLRGHQDTLMLQATDGDGDPVLSVLADLSALPPGNDATFSTGLSPSGVFECRLLWTATAADTGHYPVSFIAKNALTGPPDTVLIYTIDHAVDIDPVVTCPDTVRVVVGVPATFSVTAADPDGDPLFELVPTEHPPGSNVNHLIHRISWTRTVSGATAAGTLQIRVDAAGYFPVRFEAMNAGHGFGTTLVVASP